MKIKYHRNRIAYTILIALMLCTVLVFVTTYIYHDAADKGLESLHIQTSQIKENIDLQILSDRENLATMAGFASKLYSDGEDFSLLFNSFEAIGLIENVGLLMPDNTFMTMRGTLDLGDTVDFEKEAALGMHITGKVPDLTNPGRDVIRSGVPVIADGETVAILYGVVELEALKKKYQPFAQAH